MKHTLLFTLTALLLAPLAALHAAEDAALVFYVDAVRGDDGNGGLSPEEALRTLNAAQAAMDEVPEGEEVVLLLARGSVWREACEFQGLGRAPRYPAFTFGRPGLTIRAYGEGDKPTISGYDLLANMLISEGRFEDVLSVENELIESKRVTIPTMNSGVVDLHSVLGTVKINSPGAYTLTLEIASDFTRAKPRFWAVMLPPVTHAR